jgi:hypothetical protein
MELFTQFTTTSYTFLQLESGIGGNKVIAEYTTDGIVKLRDGMQHTDGMDERQTTSTVHIRPTEAFVGTLGANLVGHGIRVTKDDYNAATYRIESQVEGYDFDTGEVAFYKVTLKPESIWQPSDLPLQ